MPELVAGPGVQLTPGAGTVAVSVFITPQQYGAKADGVTDDSAAFVAAIAALHAYGLNRGGVGNGFEYAGSPKLFIPAGHYYLGTTTLDISHTLIIEGEGSGRMPAGAYGCTRLRWADGVTDAIRTQGPGTSGEATVDPYHDGSGGVYIKNLCLQGGYVGTHSNSNGLLCRTMTFVDDVLIRQFSGTGIKTWTGTVNGTNYDGNVDVARFVGVKVENCDIGFDTRGTNSNVITFINCEAYQNHTAGIIDDAGSANNTYIGIHATYNGLSDTSRITQVTYSGNHYAVRWGQATGAATNAPSGTTADNTWWAYVGTGTVDASHPTWTNGMANLVAGGDYVTLSPYPTLLLNPYTEGGGFSQLGDGTLVIQGTNTALSCIGGTCLYADSTGLSVKRLHSHNTLYQDVTDTTAQCGILSRDSSGTQIAGVVFNNNTTTYFAKAGGHYFDYNGGSNHVILADGVYVNGITALDYAGILKTSVAASGAITSASPTAGIGYATGSGGTVTQATSKSTGVTLNKVSGSITMNNAALASNAIVTFTLTNSAIAPDDNLIVRLKSGFATAGTYRAWAEGNASGSRTICVQNVSGGSLSEAVVIGFILIKGASS